MCTAPCSIQVLPDTASPEWNCRVIVRCDNRVIYGDPGLGYNVCSTEQGLARAARDTNPTGPSGGDPRLEMDLRAHRVVVSNETPR